MAFQDSEETTISSEIAEILGIEDTFDLDQDDYMQLLKKAIVESKMGGKKLTDEQLAILANERKRIRDLKESKFTVKKNQAINFISPNRKTLSPSSLKPVPFQQDQAGKLALVDKEKDKDSLYDLVSSIRKTVEDICDILKNQNEILIKGNEDARKRREREKRGKRESDLEKKDNKLLNVAKKMLAPMESIFDKIWRFIFFTLLGRLMYKMMDWMADPKNKDKLKTIGRFLKDWWPALLGAWFLFANPLGIFIRKIIGTVVKLTYKLAKFAIPKLLGFIKKNPKAAAAVALFTAGYTIPKLFPDTVDAEEKKTEKAPGTKEEKIESLKKQKENLNFFDKLQGKGSEIDEQIHFLQTGETKGYGFAKGGKIFSGLVDKDTGTTVRGAGEDTQFLPSTDGTGVLVAPGEIVMNQDQQQKMYDDTGVHPLSYVANARPKKHKGFTAVSTGGLINAFKSGGVIGADKINSPSYRKNKQALEKQKRDEDPDTDRPESPFKFNINMDLGERVKKIENHLQTSEIFKNKNINIPSVKNIIKNSYVDKDFSPSTKTFKDDYSLDKFNQVDYSSIFKKNLPKKETLRDQVLKLRMMRANSLERQGKTSESLLLKSFSMKSPFMLKDSLDSKLNYENKSKEKNPFGNFMPLDSKYFGHGKIKENSGKDIPGATDDRQSIKVHPGEFNYILPKDAVDRGAVPIVNYVVSQLDSDSTAKKSGKYNVPPPSKGKSGITVLPPITKSSGSPITGASNTSGSKVPDFSAISPSSIPNRTMICEIYDLELSYDFFKTWNRAWNR